VDGPTVYKYQTDPTQPNPTPAALPSGGAVFSFSGSPLLQPHQAPPLHSPLWSPSPLLSTLGTALPVRFKRIPETQRTLTPTHTRMHTHTRTHARTHACAYARTETKTASHRELEFFHEIRNRSDVFRTDPKNPLKRSRFPTDFPSVSQSVSQTKPNQTKPNEHTTQQPRLRIQLHKRHTHPRRRPHTLVDRYSHRGRRLQPRGRIWNRR